MLLFRMLMMVVLLAGSACAATPPNVVLIVSDDQGWGDYGFMGSKEVETPHLDRLARESLCFRRGYVPSSLCCPSLASIITGRQPHRHGITSNDPPNRGGVAGGKFQASAEFRDGRERMNQFMDAQPTLPRQLVGAGYLALQTGKWWQGDFRRGGFTHGMTKGGRHGDEGLDIGRKTLEPIYEFIEEAGREKKPFFVWYAPMLPHQPHNPPQELFEKYAKRTDSVHLARYWAMVEWFDQTCGQLLGHLERQGLAENTVVAYVVDNGWIQQRDAAGYAPKSKQSPNEGGLRTPILVRWPGRIAPRMVDTPVMSLDLYPTLLRLAGVEVPAGCDGVDLLEEAQVNGRRSVQGAVYTHNAVDLDQPAASLRWRWMLRDGMKVLVPTALEAGAHPQLFDVVRDPHEEQDLAGQKPDLLVELTGAMDGWWTGR